MRDYADGHVISSESNLHDEDCYTVMSGCAVQIKNPGNKIVKEFTEGHTFADSALEDLRLDENISKIRILPTIMYIYVLNKSKWIYQYMYV